MADGKWKSGYRIESFRLKGRACVNINNVDVMKSFENSTDVKSSLGVGVRLNKIQSSLAEMHRYIGGPRGIMQSFNRLENQTKSDLSGMVLSRTRFRDVLRSYKFKLSLN